MIHIEVIQGTQQGRAWEFHSDSVQLGRDAGNDLVIEDVHVSSVHCRLVLREGTWSVEDLGSTNGTGVLRGEQRFALGKGGQQASMGLAHGDVLLVGSAKEPVALLFKMGGGRDSEVDDTRVLAVTRIGDLVNVHEEVQRDPDQVQRLYSVLKGMRWELSLSKVLESSRDAVFALLPGATHLCLLLRDPMSGDFIPMLSSTRSGKAPEDGISVSRAVIDRVVSERAALVFANAPVEVGETASIMGAGILSTMAAPLWKGEEVLGVLQVDNRDSPGIFGRVELNMLMVLASQSSLSLVNAELYEKLLVAERKLDGENRYLKDCARQRQVAVVGSSQAMQRVFEQVDKVKDTPVSVLVEGETGTGKEIVASAIHYSSARADRLFVAQNCAALPETLLESELFGHAKGAFTGASRDKKGLFAVADGGTLFLDEVGEMPLSIQGKLLRVLQEGEVRPLGSNKSFNVGVRVIAATNRDLKREVAAGRFREDLFYRLNVFPIRVPPLKERPEDIPDLVQHFLTRYGREFRKNVGGASQEFIATLMGYDWPGNVRELENEIQRVVIALEDGQIATADLLSPHVRRVERMVEEAAPVAGSLRERLDEVEKWIITQSLGEHDGNRSHTARALGISREGLHKKLVKFGIK
jgi:Nif-specific regulatory protein